jgi:hypothetical protein
MGKISVSDEVQEECFRKRAENPLKHWHLLGLGRIGISFAKAKRQRPKQD